MLRSTPLFAAPPARVGGYRRWPNENTVSYCILRYYKKRVLYLAVPALCLLQGASARTRLQALTTLAAVHARCGTPADAPALTSLPAAVRPPHPTMQHLELQGRLTAPGPGERDH